MAAGGVLVGSFQVELVHQVLGGGLAIVACVIVQLFSPQLVLVLDQVGENACGLVVFGKRGEDGERFCDEDFGLLFAHQQQCHHVDTDEHRACLAWLLFQFRQLLYYLFRLPDLQTLYVHPFFFECGQALQTLWSYSTYAVQYDHSSLLELFVGHRKLLGEMQ